MRGFFVIESLARHSVNHAKSCEIDPITFSVRSIPAFNIQLRSLCNAERIYLHISSRYCTIRENIVPIIDLSFLPQMPSINDCIATDAMGNRSLAGSST